MAELLHTTYVCVEGIAERVRSILTTCQPSTLWSFPLSCRRDENEQPNWLSNDAYFLPPLSHDPI